MNFARLEDALIERASLSPDALAIGFRRDVSIDISWGELLGQAMAIADKLRRSGVGAQMPVGVFMEDKPACHASVYACFLINAVMMPIDPLWGDPLIASMLAHSGARYLVIADEHLLRSAKRIADDRAVLIATDDLLPASDWQPMIDRSSGDRSPEDLAILAFTSGSTNSPKAIPLRHRNIAAAYASARHFLFGDRLPQRFGAVLRLSGLGVLGMNYLFAHQCGAATIVLPEISINSARVFGSGCVQHQVNFVYLVPPLVTLLNKLAPVQLHQPDMTCLCAAAPLTAAAQAEFQSKFMVPLRNGYGLTEASFMFAYGEVDGDGWGLPSIGQPLSFEAQIRDARGAIVEGAGRGELWMTGPMLADGYLDNPEANAQVFVDGWLRTGDIVERDDDGLLYVVGRAKDVVLRGGFTIPFDEVEAALLAHPAVIDACAVGIENPVIGEELYAAVSLRSEFPDAEGKLLHWVRKQLGTQRAPRRVFVIQALERNGAGKLIRPKNHAIIAKRIEISEA